MDEQVELVAEKRETIGKQVKQLRREGLVPGVMYGHDFDAVPLQFDEHDLNEVLTTVGGSQLIRIKVGDDEQMEEMALIRDVQREPIRRDLLHVDFYRVNMEERLTAEVPLLLTGESPVVERNEGILLTGLSTLEIECLPGNLVDSLEVDLSVLEEVDDALYVRDLAIPAGIDVLSDIDEMVARVAPLEEELELEEPVTEPTLEAGEVEVVGEAEEVEEMVEEGEIEEETVPVEEEE